MKLPALTELNASREMIEVFGGYNHNLRISEGEFYDMENLTSSHYPVMSPRGKRGTYLSVGNPQGMIAKDALCYVDGEYFVMNEYRIPIGLSTKAKDCPKKLVSMGAYVIILPDAKWVNTSNVVNADGNINHEDGYGNINASFTNATRDQYVKFTMCGSDGEAYKFDYEGADEPTEKVDENGQKIPIENGSLWLDKSSNQHSVKMYSASSKMWVSIATTYIKIYSEGIANDFNQFDGVTISGLKDTVLINYNNEEELSGPAAKQLSEIDGGFVVWDKDKEEGNWILIVGLLDTEMTIKNHITIKREMPVLDFVIESQNRLWGCRYGEDKNGNVVNEIYASKQGDFKNWSCYMGIATDSYAASCGTDGKFTGAITHMGYPIFFKENYMHKIYGNYPANYQIQSTACRGVQDGSGDSLAIVNEVLYYKSRNAICAYDGSLPSEMSSALGDVSYSNAVACGHGNKYYISMKDNTDASDTPYRLFVYDAKRGVWHKEDKTQVSSFCSCRDELYYVDSVDNSIKTMFGSGTVDTAPVKWMAESGVIGCSSTNKKYVSKLNLRLSLDIGTRVYIYIQYDSMGEWEYLSSFTGTALKAFSLPIRPKRCDHFRIRIAGEGDAKIYSITKTIEQGSEI